MLVITRKANEGITLYTSDGEVYISFSTGNPNIPIKVAIEAPQAVTGLRDKLIKRSKEIN